MPQVDEDVNPTVEPGPQAGFVKVPTQLLGKVLDYKGRRNGKGVTTVHGHGSANAIYALAIKLAHGDDWVLNEQRFQNRYGIGWRRFEEGLAVLKECGVIRREQNGRRTFAEESFVDHQAEPYIPLDRRLLEPLPHEDGSRSVAPALVAFVAAVLLCPNQQRPADVARRFGITSKVTIRALVKHARRYIAHHVDATTGTVLVARRGHEFNGLAPPVRNGTTKSGTTKNGAHSKKEDLTKKEDPKEDERKNATVGLLASRAGERLPASRADDARLAAQAGPHRDRVILAGGLNGGEAPVDGKMGFQGGDRPEVGRPDFGRIVLASWWSTAYFRRRRIQPVAGDNAPEATSSEDWRHQVMLYGGVGDQVQLLTDHADRQVCEIAAELRAASRLRVPAYAAVLALACAVATAHREGRVIRSLGFIAERLYRKARRDKEGAWAFNLPRRAIRVTDAEYDAAAETAAKWADILGSFNGGKSIHVESLRSTPRVEELAEYLRDHGRDAMVLAINHVTANNIWQDRTVHGWGYFADYIEAAREAQQAKERDSGREEYERQEAAAMALGAARMRAAEEAGRQMAAETAAARRAKAQELAQRKQTPAWEADVAVACEWLEKRLGGLWHASQRVSAAARRAGIGREVYEAARERLQCQKWRAPPVGHGDLNGRWCVAMPGVPLEWAA